MQRPIEDQNRHGSSPRHTTWTPISRSRSRGQLVLRTIMCHIFVLDTATLFKFCTQIERGQFLTRYHKLAFNWAWPGSCDPIWKFWNPYIVRERIYHALQIWSAGFSCQLSTLRRPRTQVPRLPQTQELTTYPVEEEPKEGNTTHLQSKSLIHYSVHKSCCQQSMQ